MITNFFRWLGGIGIYVIAFLIPVFGLTLWYKLTFLTPVDSDSQELITFTVQPGWSISQIGEDLEVKNLVRNSIAIVTLSKKFAEAEEDGKLSIVSGEYSVSRSQTPNEIIKTLLSGKVVKHEMKIPPNTNINEAAIAMAASGLISEEDALKALRDPRLMSKLGIPAYIPEGFIFEGTYTFTKPALPAKIVQTLINEGRKKLALGVIDWESRAQKIGFRPYQILILASLIQKTSDQLEQQKKFSSIFHNRLRIELPLENADALVYGNPGFAASTLTPQQKKTPGPYNTYLKKGLPQTPICTPSLAAIKAALFPEDSDDLYYISNGDGTFSFSVSKKDHRRKVKASRESILGEISIDG